MGGRAGCSALQWRAVAGALQMLWEQATVWWPRLHAIWAKHQVQSTDALLHKTAAKAAHRLESVATSSSGLSVRTSAVPVKTVLLPPSSSCDAAAQPLLLRCLTAVAEGTQRRQARAGWW